MGEINVRVELANALEQEMAKRGLFEVDDVAKLELEMLVDTGTVLILLPQEVIEKLRLPEGEKTVVVFADDRKTELTSYHGLMVRIGERTGYFECLAGPPNCEGLIGQIVLERLDLIIDPLKRQLLPRPESPFLPLVKMK